MHKLLIPILFAFLLNFLAIKTSASNREETYQQSQPISWTYVESLIERKADADSIVVAIERMYAIAIRQNNIPLQVKAIYYKAVVVSTSRLFGRYEAINFLESELKKKSGTIVPVLQIILADFYNKLGTDSEYNNNQKDSLTTSVALWSRSQIWKRSYELIELSLNNELSKKIRIAQFAEIFDGKAYPERPYLYDFIAHYAIGNFSLNSQAKPIHFNSNLYSLDYFLSLNRPSHPRQSLYYDWLKFHKESGNIRAFIHIELKRIGELWRWYTEMDSIDLYNEKNHTTQKIYAFERLYRAYGDSEAQVEIIAELVSSYFAYANHDYIPPPIRAMLNWDRFERLLDKALAKNIDSPATEKCKNLKTNLSASYIKLTLPEEFPPNFPIKASIAWRNITQLAVKVENNEFLEKYNISIPLWRNEEYYQNDTITLSNGLPLGWNKISIYGGADTDTLVYNLKTMDVASFGISLKDTIIGVTVNRNSGAPISNVKLKRRGGWVDREETLSDSLGFYHFKNEAQYSLGFNMDDVKTNIPEYYDNYEFMRYDGTRRLHTKVLTDRKIYRPGQEIKFKAITTYLDEANNFFEAFKDEFYLALPNEKKPSKKAKVSYIESIDGKSHIVHGSFKIPEHCALGTATIGVYNLSGYSNRYEYQSLTYFKIEEYKRPTFEVKVDSLLWNSAQGNSYIVGSVMGYAGFAIDSALVEISVYRPVNTTITCHTNKLGYFSVPIAEVDNKHYFSVRATSQSGETQSISFEGTIQNPIPVELSIPDTVYLPGPHSISINSFSNYTSGEIEIGLYYGYRFYNDYRIKYSGTGQSIVIIDRTSIPGYFTPGRYIATYISGGNTIASKEFHVLPREYKPIAYLDKEEYLIGDTAVLTIQTEPNTYPVVFIERKGSISESILVDTTFYQHRIPIPEYGPIGYWVAYAKSNEVVKDSGLVNISNKAIQLNIELLTYRNKLLPNSKEEWKIRVTDVKGKPVVADITAAMYDASLDSYNKNNWQSSFFYENILHSTFYHIRNQTSSMTISQWNEVNHKKHFSFINWNFTRTEPQYKKIREQKYRKDEIYDVSNFMSEPNARSLSYTTHKKTKELPKLRFEELPFEVPVRKNLNETVFFYPDIRTDSLGYANISFTMNEALTRWRLMLFALSKDMYFGYSDAFTTTQMPLMIKPNPPRFLRTGDALNFTTSVINTTDSTLKGLAHLEFFNLETQEILNADYINDAYSKDFAVQPKGSATIQWRIRVPKTELSSIGYRLKAITDKISDGEENALPILSNRELLTESFTFNVPPNSANNYTFDKFKNNLSATAENHKLEFNLVKKPLWEVLTALPYLITYPYGCSEQIMSRVFANILALELLERNKDLQDLLNDWNADFENSPFNESPELSQTLAEEIPWHRHKSSGKNRKAYLAKQFNPDYLRSGITIGVNNLKRVQMEKGGFSWMPGGEQDHYITRLLPTKILHLQALGIDISKYGLKDILDKSISANKEQFLASYKDIIESTKTGDRSYRAPSLDPLTIQMLYLSSYEKSGNKSIELTDAMNYFTNQAKSNIPLLSPANQAMVALTLYRSGDTLDAKRIIAHLEGQAYKDENQGMWWEYSPWYWHTQPIESQAVIIEAFNEIKKDPHTVNLLKMWLIKQRETNRWISTKATVEAVYALLVVGDKMPVAYKPYDIRFGREKLLLPPKESLSGYINKQWFGEEISKTKAQIKIKNPNSYSTSGNMSWQYFEDIDKVGGSKGEELTVEKHLYRMDKGEAVLLTDRSTIKVGDRIKVQLTITAKKDMEYLFLKDLRSSGFEPEDVLSGYRWGGSCSYYLSSRDASTQFFFNRIRMGTHTVNYYLNANLEGEYNNGYASIECMYAPSIRSRTPSMNISIENNN